jgi:hypothetical protein
MLVVEHIESDRTYSTVSLRLTLIKVTHATRAGTQVSHDARWILFHGHCIFHCSGLSPVNIYNVMMYVWIFMYLTIS